MPGEATSASSVVPEQATYSSSVIPEQASPSPLVMPGQATSSSSVMPEQASAKARGKKRTYTTADGSTRSLRSKTNTRVELPSSATNVDKALTDTMKNQARFKTELANIVQAMCPANRQLLLNRTNVTNLTLEDQLENIDNTVSIQPATSDSTRHTSGNNNDISLTYVLYVIWN
ncbi:unnamed protein product [Absidia cylindrospora]